LVGGCDEDAAIDTGHFFGERQLEPDTLVHAVKFERDWAIVAREGEKMVYVQVQAVAKIR